MKKTCEGCPIQEAVDIARLSCKGCEVLESGDLQPIGLEPACEDCVGVIPPRSELTSTVKKPSTLVVVYDGGPDDVTIRAVFTNPDLRAAFEAAVRPDSNFNSSEVPLNPFAAEFAAGQIPFTVGFRRDGSVAFARKPWSDEVFANTDGSVYFGRHGYWREDQSEYVFEDLAVVTLFVAEPVMAISAARDQIRALADTWPDATPVRIFSKVK